MAGVRRGIFGSPLAGLGRVASRGGIRGGGSGGGRREGGRRLRLMGDGGGRPGVVSPGVGGRPRAGAREGEGLLRCDVFLEARHLFVQNEMKLGIT